MNRRLLFAIGTLVACLLAWWLMRSPKRTEEQATGKSDQLRSAVASTKTPKTGLADEKPAKEMEADYIKLNDRQIEFYGKAVDQHGNPVPDAEVIGGVLTARGFNASVGEYRTRTDTEGKFQFKGLVGASLGIAIRKAGYEQDLRGGAGNDFKFSLMYGSKNVHRPAPDRPVIFNMWKLAGPEPMVEVRKFWGIESDGRIYTLDLVAGKKQESADAVGDFRLRLFRPKGVSLGDKYDWSFTLEGIGGGLIEIADRFPYLAPESGYQAKCELNFQSAATNWVGEASKQFYFSSRNGKVYGRLQVRINPNYQQGPVVDVRGYVNPSGSRNLEWDSSKRISSERIAAVGLEKAIEEAKSRAPGT